MGAAARAPSWPATCSPWPFSPRDGRCRPSPPTAARGAAPRSAPPSASTTGRSACAATSSRPPAQLAQQAPGCRVLPVDGSAIAQRHGLGRIVNSALLGAFACAVGEPDLWTLSGTIADAAPKDRQQNVDACLAGYRLIEAQLRKAAA